MERPPSKLRKAALLSRGFEDYLKETAALCAPLVVLVALLTFIGAVAEGTVRVDRAPYYAILFTSSSAGGGLALRNLLHRPRRKNSSAFFLSVFLVINVTSVVYVGNAILNPPKRLRNERKTIENLWKLRRAQEAFRARNAKTRGVQEYAPTVEDLVKTGFLDARFGKGELDGYLIYVVSTDPDPLFPHWCARADPIEPGGTGRVFYYMDPSGSIRGSRSEPAGPRDPMVEY